MKIRFTIALDLNRAPKPSQDGEPYREVDIYAATENQGHPRMIGFQREDATIVRPDEVRS